MFKSLSAFSLKSVGRLYSCLCHYLSISIGSSGLNNFMITISLYRSHTREIVNYLDSLYNRISFLLYSDTRQNPTNTHD